MMYMCRRLQRGSEVIAFAEVRQQAGARLIPAGFYDYDSEVAASMLRPATNLPPLGSRVELDPICCQWGCTVLPLKHSAS